MFNQEFVPASQSRFIFESGACPAGERCVAYLGRAEDGDGYRVSGSLALGSYVERAAQSIVDQASKDG